MCRDGIGEFSQCDKNLFTSGLIQGYFRLLKNIHIAIQGLGSYKMGNPGGNSKPKLDWEMM